MEDLEKAAEQFRFIFDRNETSGNDAKDMTAALIGRGVVLYHQWVERSLLKGVVLTAAAERTTMRRLSASVMQ